MVPKMRFSSHILVLGSAAPGAGPQAGDMHMFKNPNFVQFLDTWSIRAPLEIHKFGL